MIMRMSFLLITLLYLTTSCGGAPYRTHLNKPFTSQLIQPNSCYIYWHDTDLKQQYFLQKNKINYTGELKYDLYDGSIDIIVTKIKDKNQWYVKSLYSNKLQQYFYKKLKPVIGNTDISDMRSIFNTYLLIPESDLISLVMVRNKIDCSDFGLERI